MDKQESHQRRSDAGFPRVRVDTLFDGIFAVSMTLLVLDLRLPADFHPDDNAALVAGLLGLWPKVVPYVLSFYVLGARWVASIEVRSGTECYSRAYVRCWLIYLLLITCVPFTTIVIGQYASLPAAVWLYAGNTALIALAAWRLLALTPELEDALQRRRRSVTLVVLFVSALACIALSLLSPTHALWPMALNLFAPWIARRATAGAAARAASAASDPSHP